MKTRLQKKIQKIQKIQKILKIQKIQKIQKKSITKYNVLPNYVFQKWNHHPYQCGPFAIYNLLIKHQIYYNLTKIIKLCKATSRFGTLSQNMNTAIIKINKICDINIQAIVPTVTAICDTIKKEGSVILLFHWQDANANASTDKDANANASSDKDANATSGEHYVLIESLSNYKFKVINYSFNEEVKYITSRNLKTMLFHHKNEEFNEVYPKAWGV